MTHFPHLPASGRLITLASLFAAVNALILGAASSVVAADHPDTAGWKDLIAADFSNVVEPGHWAFENGTLVANDHDTLWTKESYGNFVLDLEFKVAQESNSGVFLRSSDITKPLAALEIQVHESADSSKYGMVAALYDAKPSAKSMAKPVGQWNRFTITCRDSLLTVVFNGETVIDVDLNNWPEAKKNPDGTPNKFPVALKDFARSGPIGLQGLHGKAQAPVWYRNLKIKPLDANPATNGAATNGPAASGAAVNGAAADGAAQAVAKYVPPVLKAEEILPGQIKEFRFTASKIFPGTVRDVTIFIPAQYNGQKPACVYVKTDGFNPREKTLLETSIAAKEMPVTIGVFVRPGELPAPMPGTAGRRNRDFEYDGVSDNNVRFLIEELLPFVAQEYDLKLSTDGNDRCMAGGSSGGIAAFTAAWNRPDAFSRVYAASGSWVAFRGGHEFPTMVRKFEAKPIRAFLTTATHDMENCAGDWYLLDQEMDKALKFSGYDYQFRTIDGRHVAGYAEHWQEAMAYLWRGWPERVAAGPSAPRAQEILVPGEGWQLVAEGFKSTRGPASNGAGEVFFADTSNNKIHRIGLDGQLSVFVDDAAQAHCVTVGPDGTLFTISEKSGKLMRYDAAGRATVVIDDILGHSILARPDGTLYVTSNGDKPNAPGTIWRIHDGKKQQVDTGIKFATGMAYRPDQWLLSVAEGHSKWVYSYQINDDGTLTNKERFFHLHVADWDDDAGAECVCYSLEGRQFVATRSGVQISADDGPTQVILPVPDRSRVTGVALGGPEKNTLFAFCGNKIWKRKIRQHAVGAFSPWTKVTPTKL